MAQRFRLMQVRNNALVRKILFDIPSTTTNNVTIPYINPNQALHDYGAFAETVVNGSGGTLIDFTPNFLWAEWIGDSGYQYLEGYGFTNGITPADMQAGDKFYVNRWDNSHSYIEVIDKVSTGAGLNIVLDYKTPDGVTAYSNVIWNISWNANQYNAHPLPWLWNLNNPGNYNLVTMDLSIYMYGGNNGIFTQGKENKAPTGQDAAEAFWDNAEIIDPDNPYEPGGTSGETDYPPGNFSDDSDDLDDDTLPDETKTGAVGTGFATLFSPSKSQLRALADVMWGNSIVSFLQNQVENIQSMFVSLGILPFPITKGATRKVMWLGVVDTAIYLDTASKQFFEFDMGTIDMSSDPRLYSSGTALDFSPFSKLGIYLPFIGYQELNIDECRNTTLQLKYKVDIMSGSCVAKIFVNGNPIYQFSGNCMTQIPLTGQDAQTLFTNAVNVGIAAVGAKTAGAVASAGDALAGSQEISSEAKGFKEAQNAARVTTARTGLEAATANGMMGMKPSYDKTGAVGASTSLISVRQPYLFLTTPRQCIPAHYQRYCGFPSNITGKLGSFSGFTVVEDIRLNGLVALDVEVSEIYQLLKTGVII